MQLFQKQEHIKNGILDASRKHIFGTTDDHFHDFFELEYMIDGTGNYLVDGISYPIQPNMVFLMSPASFHSLQNCSAEIINVMFPYELCDAATLFQLYTLRSNTIRISEEDHILVEKLLMEIVAALQRRDSDYAIQFLRSLLYKLTTLTPEPKKQVATHIQNAIIYILENFRSNITLQSTAEHVGLVPAYLSTLFVQETGIHFKTYLDNLRFDYARNLLSSTDMNITEVCVQSGFTDYTNFTRRFRQKYNTTPKNYRAHYSFR